MDSRRAENTAVELTFEEFLDLVKVVKMLYGRDVAEKCFTKGLSQLYNIDSASISKLFNQG